MTFSIGSLPHGDLIPGTDAQVSEDAHDRGNSHQAGQEAHTQGALGDQGANLVGKENLQKYADQFQITQPVKFDGITTARGNFDLSKAAKVQIAWGGIGQYTDQINPCAFLTFTGAIANGGKYYLPSLVESTIQNGQETKYNIGYPTKAFTQETAQKLKNALSLVIKDGTGTLAQPQTVSAGGKTATAQTGKNQNGRELISSWFCGFFPLEDPKYVVIIFSEDTTKQTKSCAEIFSIIADKITELP